VVLIAFTS